MSKEIKNQDEAQGGESNAGLGLLKASELVSGVTEEKRCCTVCDAKKRCHVCDSQTLYACSDCRIDFGVTIYVCPRCRRAHEETCSARLRESREALQQLYNMVQFAIQSGVGGPMSLTCSTMDRAALALGIEPATASSASDAPLPTSPDATVQSQPHPASPLTDSVAGQRAIFHDQSAHDLRNHQ